MTHHNQRRESPPSSSLRSLAELHPGVLAVSMRQHTNRFEHPLAKAQKTQRNGMRRFVADLLAFFRRVPFMHQGSQDKRMQRCEKHASPVPMEHPYD